MNVTEVVNSFSVFMLLFMILVVLLAIYSHLKSKK